MKTMTKGQFRLWLTISVVLSVCAALLDIFGEGWLPSPLQDWSEAKADGELDGREMALVGLGFPFLAVVLVNLIALYCLVWWARPMTVMVWLAGYGIQLLGGPTASLAVTDVLLDASTLITGVLLGAMYFSPVVSSWFGRPRDPVPPPLPSGGELKA